MCTDLISHKIRHHFSEKLSRIWCHIFLCWPRVVQKRVAVVDLPEMLGGVCTHTGTIPSKTFREAVLFLTGYRERGFTSKGTLPKHEYTAQAILERVRKVERWETDILRDQFTRNRVSSINGKGRFLVRLSQLVLCVFLLALMYLSRFASIDFVFSISGRPPRRSFRRRC
jgi:hypothetical protein